MPDAVGNFQGSFGKIRGRGVIVKNVARGAVDVPFDGSVESGRYAGNAVDGKGVGRQAKLAFQENAVSGDRLPLKKVPCRRRQRGLQEGSPHLIRRARRTVRTGRLITVLEGDIA